REVGTLAWICLSQPPPQTSMTPTTPPRHPLLWASISYAVGIAAGSYLWRPPLWWFVATTIFIGASIYFRHRIHLGRTLVLGAFFVEGAVHIQLRNASTHINTELLPFADGEELTITAHVIRDSQIRPAHNNESRQLLDVETEEIALPTGQTISTRCGI